MCVAFSFVYTLLCRLLLVSRWTALVAASKSNQIASTTIEHHEKAYHFIILIESRATLDLIVVGFDLIWFDFFFFSFYFYQLDIFRLGECDENGAQIIRLKEKKKMEHRECVVRWWCDTVTKDVQKAFLQNVKSTQRLFQNKYIQAPAHIKCIYIFHLEINNDFHGMSEWVSEPVVERASLPHKRSNWIYKEKKTIQQNVCIFIIAAM